MCVTFVYIDHEPTAKYKLILLNNRDEFLDRATSEAKWEQGILAGLFLDSFEQFDPPYSPPPPPILFSFESLFGIFHFQKNSKIAVLEFYNFKAHL